MPNNPVAIGAASTYDEGLAARRQVLGDEYVTRAMTGTNLLDEELQRFVTEVAWGRVWSRPGLPRTTRSLLTIGMLIALNRLEELQAHVRGAINNGCTEHEVCEVILQSAAYCGFPAALDAMRRARTVLDEL